jgi:hypothetical protein
MTEEAKEQGESLFTVKLNFKSGNSVVLYNLTKWKIEAGTLNWAFHKDHEGPMIFDPMFKIGDVEMCQYEVQKELVKFQ